MFYRFAESAAQTSETAANHATQGPIGESFIALVYGGLVLFFAYQLFKGYRARKELADPKYEFSKKVRKMNLFLVALIAAMAGYSIFAKAYLSGTMMLLLSVVFFCSMREKVVISASGIYGDSAFYRWEEIRRWGWDKSVGDLVLLTKKRGKSEENHVVRVGTDHMVEVNDRIREFKLSKGKKTKA